MKLLNLTNLYYIAFSLASVLLANIYITYRVIHFEDSEVKEHMLFEKVKIIEQLNTQPALHHNNFELGDLIRVTSIEKYNLKTDIFKDTSFLDPKEYEAVPFLQLTFQTMANGVPYEIKIRRRLTEDEDIFNGIVISFIIVGLGIILLYFIFNAWFSQTKLKPFYHALDQLKKFEVGKKNNLQLLESNIYEFKSLNTEIKKLTNKAKYDYQNLKEFTENVSHETRTPIAIVQSRLELLLQSHNLTEAELNQVSLALDAIHRLTEKNNALILLSRIDNYQYKNNEQVDMALLVQKVLSDIMPFIEEKKIKLSQQMESVPLKNINAALLEILVSNLLLNAIRYNLPGGELKVICNPGYITIINSSEQQSELSPEVLSRYMKGEHPDASGLGLAIVQKICLLNKFELSYTYHQGLHYFSVIFQNS